MELAAEQGAEHLLPEIDRRIALLATSRGRVSWRQRPAFVRDLDGVRDLIAHRLASLDREAAKDRMVAFLALAPHSQTRTRDNEGALERVFAHAAEDFIRLIARGDSTEGGARLAAAIADQPVEWARWTRSDLLKHHPTLARAALSFLPARTGEVWAHIVRTLADAAVDPDAYSATFTSEALREPEIAGVVAQRFLAGGRFEDARQILENAVRPGLFKLGRGGQPSPDFGWESAWIDYLEAAGRNVEAQEARWASYERTMSTERAKAYVTRLPDFEDVEAEERVFAIAREHDDAERALALLIEWPALAEAARFITKRGEELSLSPEQAEGWARRLQRRYPKAAEQLLRTAAAGAFRRREYRTSSQLTQEADAIAST
jgi:hypothetical protein